VSLPLRWHDKLPAHLRKVRQPFGQAALAQVRVVHARNGDLLLDGAHQATVLHDTVEQDGTGRGQSPSRACASTSPGNREQARFHTSIASSSAMVGPSRDLAGIRHPGTRDGSEDPLVPQALTGPSTGSRTQALRALLMMPA